MIGFGEAMRIIHINRVLLRHGLDEVILKAHLFRPIRFILYLSPWYWLRRNKLPSYPVRMRQALEDLGPIFIKFGQILSTRRDLLPREFADEFAKLQDAVPPFPGTQARAQIEHAFGCPIEDLLDDFDETPIASASVAQVHGARLKDGKQVVVKVLRPDIERVIRRDVGLLHLIANLANRYWGEARRLRPLDVVEDYKRTVLDELDLQLEAANASQLRRNWEGSDILYVPEVYWDLTSRNALVMERIHGTQISNIDALKAQGISMQKLGEQGVEVFFTQVFRDNFFHADMHPGNIFVEPSGRYIAVDFGIVGSLTTDDQRYLAENLLAFFNRDYRRVAELHVESEWVPSGTRVDEFETAIRSVCEPIFNKPLSEISFGHFLLNLFQTARRFDMEVQPQLVLLQKTLLYIEGLGRQLYPELDLWATAKPYLERWMEQQVGPKAFARKLKKNLPMMTEYAADMPILLHKVLREASEGRLELTLKSKELTQLRRETRQNHRTLVATISGAAMLISGAMLLTLGPSILLPASMTVVAGAALSSLGGVILVQSWMKS
ncbi:MAG: ubiquinone biosynthesis regulatory protein kinase UbiB [Gammaproteobacteria bacterium]|nr:ubiquinone biosynthesis regulatory protein kinase UbiB [Gammaproteobacteria bacterium]